MGRMTPARVLSKCCLRANCCLVKAEDPAPAPIPTLPGAATGGLPGLAAGEGTGPIILPRGTAAAKAGAGRLPHAGCTTAGRPMGDGD